MDKNKETQENQQPTSFNQDLLLLYVTRGISGLTQVFLGSVFLYWFWNNHLVVLSFYRLPTIQFGFFPTFLLSLCIISRAVFSGLFYGFPSVVFTNSISFPTNKENDKK